ncbi:MAG: peptide ABC transporter ATP-binding protein [Candidatus Omnitrophota bacterium]|nr:MAG: peptide ABC transporter ATP-binding protein [Candidatus Omnitrophota bacterium]
MYILEVKNLKVYFSQKGKVLKAVDGISFFIREGESLGLAGESGSGKTVTALSLTRLVSHPYLLSGEVLFRGKNIFRLKSADLRKIRGAEIAYIFQNPLSSLNPVFTVGNQMIEIIRLHHRKTKREAEVYALKMLEKVGIPDAYKNLRSYPHQLSGGMNQRVMIAMALSCHPSLLIADEPTTNLDATTQVQILQLIERIKKEERLSLLFITHDLEILRRFTNRVAIMYAGQIVEIGENLFEKPFHPYTYALLSARSGIIPEQGLKGEAPSPFAFPAGCRFHPRCPFKRSICEEKEPILQEKKKGHFVACHFPQTMVK